MQKQKGSKMVFGIAVQLYFKKNLSNFLILNYFLCFFIVGADVKNSL